MSLSESLLALKFCPNSLYLLSNSFIRYDQDLKIPTPVLELSEGSVGRIYERIAPLACLIFGNHSYDIRFFNPKHPLSLKVKLISFGHHMEFQEVCSSLRVPRIFLIPAAANDGYWSEVLD